MKTTKIFITLLATSLFVTSCTKDTLNDEVASENISTDEIIAKNFGHLTIAPNDPLGAFFYEQFNLDLDVIVDGNDFLNSITNLSNKKVRVIVKTTNGRKIHDTVLNTNENSLIFLEAGNRYIVSAIKPRS